MEIRDEINQAINARLNRLLLVAETALPEKQFRAFRKITLDEFGKSGFDKDLEQIIVQKNKERKG
jgi:hypothetical protein